MKPIRATTLLAPIALAAGLLALGGCPFLLGGNGAESPGGPDGSGTVSLRFVVPTYEHREVADGARIVAPQTQELRLLLDDEAFITVNLSSMHQTAGDGHDPVTVYESTVAGVPARRYSSITLDMVDTVGEVLSSGTAFDVDIVPFDITPLTFYCYSTSYTWLTVGGDAVAGSVPLEEMRYFKFPAKEGLAYTVTLTGTPSPDLYLFKPDGTHVRTGAGEQTDPYLSAYWDGDDATLSFTAATSGMHVVGVYGWTQAATFSIAVAGTADSPAQRYVDLGYGALRDGRMDDALTAFTQAIITDPSHPEAIIGYSAMNLVAVLLDADLVQVATANLGIVDYPTTVDAVLSTDWLEDTVYPGGSSVFAPLPTISGEMAFDGYFDDEPDGLIDINEKLMAFLSYYVSHNLGLTPVATVFGTLAARFDASAAILATANENMKLTLTWDMFFDTPLQARDAGWPPDLFAGPGEYAPFTVTIGKAELLAMAASFRVVQSLALMTRVYSLDLIKEDGTSLLQDYWDSFGQGNFDPGSFPRPPFSIVDFLKPTAEASLYLAQSKEAMLAGLENSAEALSLVGGRVEADGFFLFPELITAMFGIEGTDLIAFSSRATNEAMLSIEDPEHDYPFIMPLPEPDEFGAYASSWPTTIDGEKTIGANLSVLFDYPLTNLFELSATGEPVWYTLEGAQFRALTVWDMASIVPTQENSYYVRAPDFTARGLVPLANVPTDDPATRFGIASMDWPDLDMDGLWDPNEAVTRVWVEWKVEGLVDVGNTGAYPPGGPEELYSGQVYRETFVDWLDTDLTVLEMWTEAANTTALRNKIVSESAVGLVELRLPSYTMDFLVFRDGAEIFVALPELYVWHSVTLPGTQAVDPATGEMHTSSGSAWWAFFWR